MTPDNCERITYACRVALRLALQTRHHPLMSLAGKTPVDTQILSALSGVPGFAIREAIDALYDDPHLLLRCPRSRTYVTAEPTTKKEKTTS